jgi:hypothetical protein
LASPPTSPIGVRRAGLGGEIVELVVEQDAGALGDEAEAVAEVQRVGVGDRVAVAVDTEKCVVLSPSSRGRIAGADLLARAGAMRIDGRAPAARRSASR